MFTRSTAGAGRSVKSLFASPCISTHSYTVPIGEALSTRSRRHSSSKASCPPGGSRGSVPAADAGKSANDEKSSEAKEKRLASSRMARRRQKDNDFTADYPRAPSTSDIAPVDIQLASFFSEHRPMSIVHSIPQTYSTDSFNNMFEPRSPRDKTNDVIYTLSNAVSALEGGHQSAEEKNVRWEVMQQNNSDASGNERTPMFNLEELVKQFRPFNVPPAPVPFDMTKEALPEQETKPRQIRAKANRPTRKTYQTTLFIHKTTSASGETTFSTSATPLVERKRAPPSARQPFLARLGTYERQVKMIGEPVEEVADDESAGMWLISVKRQRKLKMKKHKYKKLMRRTRNLRRRLGKT